MYIIRVVTRQITDPPEESVRTVSTVHGPIDTWDLAVTLSRRLRVALVQTNRFFSVEAFPQPVRSVSTITALSVR